MPDALARIGQPGPPPSGRDRLGRMLLDRGEIAPAALAAALAAQRASGARLGDALRARGLARSEALARALADQRGLPLVDPGADPPDPALIAAAGLDAMAARRAMPWRADPPGAPGRLVIVTPEPDRAAPDGDLAAIAAALNLPPGARPALALCSPEAWERAWLALPAERRAARAAQRTPEPLSARRLGGRAARAGFVAVFAGLAAAAAAFPAAVLDLLFLAALALNAVNAALRLAAICLSRPGPPQRGRMAPAAWSTAAEIGRRAPLPDARAIHVAPASGPVVSAPVVAGPVVAGHVVGPAPGARQGATALAVREASAAQDPSPTARAEAEPALQARAGSAAAAGRAGAMEEPAGSDPWKGRFRMRVGGAGGPAACPQPAPAPAIRAPSPSPEATTGGEGAAADPWKGRFRAGRGAPGATPTPNAARAGETSRATGGARPGAGQEGGGGPAGPTGGAPGRAAGHGERPAPPAPQRGPERLAAPPLSLHAEVDGGGGSRPAASNAPSGSARPPRAPAVAPDPDAVAAVRRRLGLDSSRRAPQAERGPAPWRRRDDRSRATSDGRAGDVGEGSAADLAARASKAAGTGEAAGRGLEIGRAGTGRAAAGAGPAPSAARPSPFRPAAGPGAFPHAAPPAPPAPPAARLPMVTLMAPLHREPAAAPGLVAALRAIDYPPERLEALIALEHDDDATAEAIRAADPPPWLRIIPAPPGGPRTKPRAMNHALDLARGEIVGIYDAEDRPDPGQIRRAAEIFAAAPPRVACLQARLAFHNSAEGWLPRCFAIEYIQWFHLILPAMRRMGFPLPLGGTSLFFRRRALERLGAWDAWNVTEDADLGLRLARAGYETGLIDSDTQEEAVSRPWAWIRQRSRWQKGYVHTWVTHMRRPWRLWRELGTVGFLGFQAHFIGAASAFLGQPLLWSAWFAWSFYAAGFEATGLPPAMVAALLLALHAGQVVMLAGALVALRRAGRMELAPCALTLPFYWPLATLSAVKSLVETVAAPMWWDKTEHGAGLKVEAGAPTTPSRRSPSSGAGGSPR